MVSLPSGSRIVTGSPRRGKARRLEIKRDARGVGEVAPCAVVRPVGEGVAGQRGCLVAELLRIFRRPARRAFRPQIGRNARRIGIRRVAIGFAEDLLGQDQRFAAHQRAEVPELAERQADEGARRRNS